MISTFVNNTLNIKITMADALKQPDCKRVIIKKNPKRIFSEENNKLWLFIEFNYKYMLQDAQI